MTTYRYLAADSLTGAIREEVPLASTRYARVLDRSGAVTASLPLVRKKTTTYLRPYSQTIGIDSPAGYWRLDEQSGTTAFDVSGNGRDGSYLIPATFTLASDGLLAADNDRGVLLTGGRVDVADNAAWSPATTGFLTVSALFQVNSIPGVGQFMPIASKDDPTTAREWILRVDHSAVVHLVLLTTAGATLLDLATVTPVIVPGVPYIVVARITDGGTCSVDLARVDIGQVAATRVTGTATGATTNTTALLHLGQDGNGGATLVGTLDEVAVFPTFLGDDRVAAEVASAQGQLETVTTSYNPVMRSVLDPGRTNLLIERNGVIVANYFIWNARAMLSTNTLEISGEGLWSYFGRRLFRPNGEARFGANTPGFIAFFLTLAGTATAASVPFFVNIGSLVNVGPAMAITYPDQRSTIQQLIEDLAALDDSIDFSCEIDGATGIGTMTYYYPLKGNPDPTIVFDLPMLDELELDVDGSQLASMWDAVGANSGKAALKSTAADPLMSATYPEYQGTANYPDIKVLNQLQARARGDLKRHKKPLELPTVKFRPTRPDLQVGTWSMGDRCRVRGTQGWLALDSLFRITADEIQVGADYDEVVTITLVPPEALV